MHVAMVKGCGGCPFSREAWAVTGVLCAHPKAPYGTYISEDEASSGRLPEACPLRRWSCLIQAAEAPVQSIDVEPPRGPLVTQEERDAAMEKALSCLVEDLAQWREERPTEGRERACCDLHSAKEEG